MNRYPCNRTAAVLLVVTLFGCHNTPSSGPPRNKSDSNGPGKTQAAGGTAPRGPRGRLTGHAGVVEGLAFSPDGKTLATASTDRSVRLWDPITCKERLRLLGHTDTVQTVVFSPDGKTLASAGADGTIRLWDPTSGKELAVLEGGGGAALAFSPDGKTIVRGDPVTVWNLETRKPRYTIPQPPQSAFGTGLQVAYSPDGKYIAGKCGDGVVHIWDAVDGLERHVLKKRGGYGFAAAFTWDGKLLASAGQQGTDTLSDPMVNLDLPIFDGYFGDVDSLVLSPDGKTLIGPEFTFWDVSTRKVWGTFPATVDYEGIRIPLAIRQITISPDRKTLVTSFESGVVALWDIVLTQ